MKDVSSEIIIFENPKEKTLISLETSFKKSSTWEHFLKDVSAKTTIFEGRRQFWVFCDGGLGGGFEGPTSSIQAPWTHLDSNAKTSELWVQDRRNEYRLIVFRSRGSDTPWAEGPANCFTLMRIS